MEKIDPLATLIAAYMAYVEGDTERYLILAGDLYDYLDNSNGPEPDLSRIDCNDFSFGTNGFYSDGSGYSLIPVYDPPGEPQHRRLMLVCWRAADSIDTKADGGKPCSVVIMGVKH